jgi:hypothetical protein
MAKRVAVVLTERALGRSAHVRKDQVRRRLRRDPLEIRAVPGRHRRGEETRRIAQLRVRVKANPEPVGIALAAAGVLSGESDLVNGAATGPATRKGCPGRGAHQS